MNFLNQPHPVNDKERVWYRKELVLEVGLTEIKKAYRINSPQPQIQCILLWWYKSEYQCMHVHLSALVKFEIATMATKMATQWPKSYQTIAIGNYRPILWIFMNYIIFVNYMYVHNNPYFISIDLYLKYNFDKIAILVSVDTILLFLHGFYFANFTIVRR